MAGLVKNYALMVFMKDFFRNVNLGSKTSDPVTQLIIHVDGLSKNMQNYSLFWVHAVCFYT